MELVCNNVNIIGNKNINLPLGYEQNREKIIIFLVTRELSCPLTLSLEWTGIIGEIMTVMLQRVKIFGNAMSQRKCHS